MSAGDETRLRSIIEEFDDVYFDLVRRPTAAGVEYVFADVNRVGTEVVHMTRQELIGRGLLEMFPNERARSIVAEFERAHTSGQAASYERRSEAPRVMEWFSYRVVPTREGVAVLARVITERKRVEAAHAELQERLRHAQKMESLGRLASGIAHDFNNLLTPIRAYTQLALDRLAAGAAVQEELAEIRSAADRAGALVREIVAFGRRDSGHEVALSLSEVVAGLARRLRLLVGDEVELRLELAPDLGVTRCDPLHLEQVLTNLATNARDATPPGGRITVRTRNMSLETECTEGSPPVPPGRYVALTVEDTGEGIAPELLGRVFEPFFTTKDHAKGTGLGLSIVYNLVTGHGGHVSCRSALGRGTEFLVYLPRTGGERPPHPSRG